VTVRKQFESHFSENNLDILHDQFIALSPAVGIDNINHGSFKPVKDEQIKIISRKVLNGKYSFTKYKLKLISKGRNKVPREIAIPTIRDRIALRALCDFLVEHYSKTIAFEMPQTMVKKAKEKITSNTYDEFIKLDVSNFYPSIIHQELKSRLKKKIRNPEIVAFIESAIKTPTVIKSDKNDLESKIGIPQGLSISNILAEIYLINLDRTLSSLPKETLNNV